MLTALSPSKGKVEGRIETTKRRTFSREPLAA